MVLKVFDSLVSQMRFGLVDLYQTGSNYWSNYVWMFICVHFKSNCSVKFWNVVNFLCLVYVVIVVIKFYNFVGKWVNVMLHFQRRKKQRKTLLRERACLQGQEHER